MSWRGWKLVSLRLNRSRIVVAIALSIAIFVSLTHDFSTFLLFALIGVIQAVVAWYAGHLSVTAFPPQEQRSKQAVFAAASTLLITLTIAIGVLNDRNNYLASEKVQALQIDLHKLLQLSKDGNDKLIEASKLLNKNQGGGSNLTSEEVRSIDLKQQELARQIGHLSHSGSVPLRTSGSLIMPSSRPLPAQCEPQNPISRKEAIASVKQLIFQLKSPAPTAYAELNMLTNQVSTRSDNRNIVTSRDRAYFDDTMRTTIDPEIGQIIAEVVRTRCRSIPLLTIKDDEYLKDQTAFDVALSAALARSPEPVKVEDLAPPNKVSFMLRYLPHLEDLLIN